MKDDCYDIVSDVAAPERRMARTGTCAKLRATYRKMRVGDSFVYQGLIRYPYYVAETIGCKIKTERMEGGATCRIWLIGKRSW